MAANVSTVNVSSPEQMQEAVMSYVAQGFIVSTQTNETTTLFKKKEFNVLWAVIGFFLCLLPLLIYCIVYATQRDQMVVIRVGHIALADSARMLSEHSRPGVEELTWSEDRKYWWSGKTWINAQNTVPPDAPRTEDGELWWDGERWRPAPSPTTALNDAHDADTESRETDTTIDATQPTTTPDPQNS